MRSKYQDPLLQANHENNNKMKIIIALSVVILSLVGLSFYLAKTITVTIKPGITSPTTMKRGQIDDVNAYALAERLMMSLYLWKDDGKTDYLNKINSLNTYLSERCELHLKDDYSKRLKSGELGKRVRQLNPLQFEHSQSMIKSMPPNKWIVKLDFHLKETLNGLPIKNGHYVWHVPILRDESDPLNKFGMVIDCPFTNNSPYRVEEYQNE